MNVNKQLYLNNLWIKLLETEVDNDIILKGKFIINFNY